MNEEQVRRIIKEELESLIKSDHYTFSKRVEFSDGKDIVFGLNTGTKFGTSALQKIGFWDATPVIRQSSTGEATGVNVGSGLALKHDATFTGNSGSTAFTLSDIVKHLKAYGLIPS
jgi:hypothetical protein